MDKMFAAGSLWITHLIRSSMWHVSFRMTALLLLMKSLLGNCSRNRGAWKWRFSPLFSSFPSVTQNIFSRPSLFDGTQPLSAVDDAIGVKPASFWLNVQVSVLSNRLFSQSFPEVSWDFTQVYTVCQAKELVVFWFNPLVFLCSALSSMMHSIQQTNSVCHHTFKRLQDL